MCGERFVSRVWCRATVVEALLLFGVRFGSWSGGGGAGLEADDVVEFDVVDVAVADDAAVDVFGALSAFHVEVAAVRADDWFGVEHAGDVSAVG